MFRKHLMMALLLMTSLFANNVHAQDEGHVQLFLGDGIVSYDQFNGVTASSTIEVPYELTGALFFSARYFITDHFAIGLAIGTDNVKGRISMGNPKENGGNESSPGYYVRNTFTIAPEFFLKYKGDADGVMTYGYIGIGYTKARLTRVYDENAYNYAYNNGVNSLSPINPVISDQDHLAIQVTFWGIRFGGRVAAYLEFGYGYKGLINAGIAVHL